MKVGDRIVNIHNKSVWMIKKIEKLDLPGKESVQYTLASDDYSFYEYQTEGDIKNHWIEFLGNDEPTHKKELDPQPILAKILDGLLKLEMVKRVAIDKAELNSKDYNIICYFSNNKILKHRLSFLEMELAIFDIGEAVLEEFYTAILKEEKRIY